MARSPPDGEPGLQRRGKGVKTKFEDCAAHLAVDALRIEKSQDVGSTFTKGRQRGVSHGVRGREQFAIGA